MKALYIDCGMGAAGDMLTAALLELLPEPEKFVGRLNALGIPGVEYRALPCVKCGIKGTRMEVLVNGEEECAEEHGHHHGHAHNDAHIHEHNSCVKDEHCRDAGQICREEHIRNEANEHSHEHEYAHEQTHKPVFCGEYGHDQEAEEQARCEEHIHDVFHEHAHEHGHTHGHACGGHHHHAGMSDIESIFAGLDMPEEAKADALAVYKIIAEAESAVHGVPVTEIHFHEVGAMDAVADVAAVSLLMHELSPVRVAASPVHVGSGTVRCAHGVLPVPAPATARILEGMPVYGGEVRGELCTPTGAALLKRFVTDFGPMPLMRLEKTGYGMGKKDFGDRANCVRAMMGEA
ncbi:MAG TPA: LarC family nickel insertion protein [Candidatus Caccocola faecipullorum]|nr:LarC family nickel insertion protein [Candidatus Caccocola faecipullorum]